MKMDLAVISPAYRFMVLLYGTPLLFAPRKMVRFVNIGRYVAPITNAELRASAVPVSLDSSGISSTDLQLEILNMLRLIKTTLNRLPFYDPTLNRGRMTAILESGTVTTVSTVTTCGTVSNMTNVGSYTWNTMVNMQNRSSWANNCGNKIS